jgi:hypothetical protein
MMISNIQLPDLGDVFLALVLTLHILFVLAAVSIPWLAAHLEYWGGLEGFKSYRVAATRLSQTAIHNLGAAIFFGALSCLIVSIRNPEKLFTAAVLLAPGLGFLLVFLAGYMGLIFLYRYEWDPKRNIQRGHILIALVAGILGAFCIACLVGLINGVSDVSLWPRLRENPWSIFSGVFFWFGWLYAFLAVFLTGGIHVMLTGREAFRWERGISISEGARLIRLGAFFSLSAIFLMVLLSGVWVYLEGLPPFRQVFLASRPELLIVAAISFAGLVALVEVLMSVLKWGGSAPRASLFAAGFLVLTVLGLTSLFSWRGSLPKQGSDNRVHYSQVEKNIRPILGNPKIFDEFNS